jgi:hypothetical protein
MAVDGGSGGGSGGEWPVNEYLSRRAFNIETDGKA